LSAARIVFSFIRRRIRVAVDEIGVDAFLIAPDPLGDAGATVCGVDVVAGAVDF